MKKKTFLLISISLVVGLFGSATAIAQHKKPHNFTINTDSHGSLTDCEQINMRVDDSEIVRSVQEQTIARSSVSSLRVRAALYGGIHVQGWDRDQYSIKACLGAAGDNTAEAQNLLSQISLSVQNGEVTVQGPSGEYWMGYLIIQAPRGAVMALEAKNAPIGIRDISGTFEARNHNGPVSLKAVTGKVNADVVNGPINISGSEGDYHLQVQNGPLNVDLLSSRWEGGELEGHTQNGPVNLRLPQGYQSSVQVDASKHSPVECRAVQCKEAARTWDQPNLIRFGDATPVVRLSTVNGPVIIKSPNE